ncbi:phosphate ABC transporter permease subunit PstC [Asticcacaulis sp. EMRT-3]|uniref:phosphate ABC transporter permease subunit PstC n=1 Tax=Asticcacaulis sp. EMRT-3 TaxID=3040349 RepID=UPI0024AF8562|nr:phosphate ABC transporter permease subunit PstC [Asticcacaulis sp. EMRT-3]MDI7776097.1 phosphate ABC transporter permease subunit PstC [Asticcacaulis sp. EMRT-3]
MSAETPATASATSQASGPRLDPTDPIFRWVSFGAATLLLAVLAGIIGSLLVGGWPALSKFGFGFFIHSTWNPVTEQYGAAGPIVGTIISSALALVFALPIAVGVAVYLTQFCPRALAQPLSTAVELLAGIPSIVYGMWGLFVFAPFFANHVQVPLMMAAKPGSLLDKLTTGIPNGANVLTASIILAIMILPYMAAVFRELFRSIPPQVREAAFGVGATPFEVTTSVIIPYVQKGMIGVIMLGLGRALGETMAVTFIIGNSHRFPKSLFDSSATLASTIANEFAEATTEMHTSALMALGFVLFLITFAVLAAARALLSNQRY